MQRTVMGFRQEDSGDWIAHLACGHHYSVRHQTRAQSGMSREQERAAQVGQALECQLCDQFEWPPNTAAYKRTPEFTAATVPAGLLKDHSTKPGVWAKIVVLEGALDYVVESLHSTSTLDPTTSGTVLPEVLHYIRPVGEVRFYVEFYRVNAGATG